MIIVRSAVVWLCLASIASTRPASFARTFGKRKTPFVRTPVKFKRQTEASHRHFAGASQPRFGDALFPEESSDESVANLRKKTSVAEMFRNRLMACGLITTKSPERWRDRLVAELDEIITDIEHRCALCKSLYDEPCRYELLRSLINPPCPPSCRKNTKKRLLRTLQKVLEKSFDNEDMPEDGESMESLEDEGGPKGSNLWRYTDVPKTRKTRSTTELPEIQLTTKADNVHTLHSMGQTHQFRKQWWPPEHERSATTPRIQYNATDTASSVNRSSSSIDAEESNLSSVHVINGQPVDNVQDFLQQYMNLVYGGQPGNEQRRQFFLDQLCRNATNGRIVLQCKDITGHRKVRSSPAKELQTWNAAQSAYTASDVRRPPLFATPTMNAVQPDHMGGRSCWCFGGTNKQQWHVEHR